MFRLHGQSSVFIDVLGDFLYPVLQTFHSKNIIFERHDWLFDYVHLNSATNRWLREWKNITKYVDAGPDVYMFFDNNKN